MRVKVAPSLLPECFCPPRVAQPVPLRPFLTRQAASLRPTPETTACRFTPSSTDVLVPALGRGVQAHEHVLDAAVVVEARELPADIVTMYSQILLSDMRTGRQRKLTLCYPHDADGELTGLADASGPCLRTIA